jgi:hypothetical protein
VSNPTAVGSDLRVEANHDHVAVAHLERSSQHITDINKKRSDIIVIVNDLEAARRRVDLHIEDPTPRSKAVDHSIQAPRTVCIAKLHNSPHRRPPLPSWDTVPTS